MKEFNLDEYLKNPSQKVVTRDGREVRIICTDFLSEMNKPIIALIKEDENKENAWNFTQNGKYHLSENKESSKDLFFAPIKREGWINIYKDNITTFTSSKIHQTEKQAKEEVSEVLREYGIPIASVKIEWEE